MIYFKDARVKIWEIEDRGNYSLIKMGSSRKDKKSDEYKNTNWSFVRFVGDAHTKIEELGLEEKDTILINGGISQEAYLDEDGNKQWPKYPQIVVFNWKRQDDEDEEEKPKKTEKKASAKSSAKKSNKKMDEPPSVEADDEAPW